MISEVRSRPKLWSRLRRGFSLRVLMLAIMVLGGGFGWLAFRARVQREAVAAIVKAKGRVYYDWEWAEYPDSNYWQREGGRNWNPPPTSPWPKWLFKLVGPDYLSSVVGVSFTPIEGIPQTDDAVIAQIGRLDHLQYLDLFNIGMTDDSLVHLKNLAQLRTLDLAFTAVNGPGLQHLRSLRMLRDLNLMGVFVTGTDLALLKDMALERVKIDSPHITDSDLACLEGLTNLKEMCISCPQITNAGLVHLKGLKLLSNLSLQGTQVDSIQSLEHLSGLTDLHLNQTRVDNAGLAPINRFPGLSYLDLDGTRITDAGLKHLAGLTELSDLRLSNTKITDAGLVELHGLSKCQYLDLGQTQVTPTGIAALAAKQSAMKIIAPNPFVATTQPEPPAMSLVDSIIFQPRKYVEAEWPAPDPSINDIWIETPDGLRLNGWYAEARSIRPRAVVLYAHGNAANIAPRRWILDLFRDRLNCSILIFDYRGYGRNEGTPSETGVLTDARAARRWLAKVSGVTEKDIVLVGHSLGGGVVVDLAAKDGARGLILENTFTSLPDVAAKIFPYLPVRMLVKTRLDSLSKIPNYHGPLLQTHGDADIVIPFELGNRLFDAAHQPKQFIRVQGGGHNDPPSREYVDAIDRFLGGLPALKPTNKD